MNKYKCVFPDGRVKLISYDQIDEQNLEFIEHMVLAMPTAGIKEFCSEEIEKHRVRMKALRDNPASVLTWDGFMYRLEGEEE